MSKDELVYTGLIGAALSQELVEQYEKALGKLAMEFSFLHVVLEQAAWWIWGLHREVGRVLTERMSFSGLVEKLRGTTKILNWDDPTISEFKTILSKAKQLSQRRNEYLHAMWNIQHGKPVLCLTNHQTKQGPTILELKKLGKEMVETATDLFRFHRINEAMERERIDKKGRYKKAD